MRMYYVYILKCADDSYYTGVTNNLEGTSLALCTSLRLRSFSFEMY
jgi:putative endonuclease